MASPSDGFVDTITFLTGSQALLWAILLGVGLGLILAVIVAYVGGSD